jgi:hypothetical protein
MEKKEKGVKIDLDGDDLRADVTLPLFSSMYLKEIPPVPVPTYNF